MLSFNEFRFTEALSNAKGKSSLGLFMGMLYGFVAIIMYVIGMVCLFINIPHFEVLFNHAFILTGASGTLIGARYFRKTQENKIEE